MAVVPTAHHVTLTYGTTGADQLGKLASLAGVVGLGMLMTLRPPDMSRPSPPEPPAHEPAPAPADEEESEAVVPARPKDDAEPVEPPARPESYGPPLPTREPTKLRPDPGYRPPRRSPDLE
jgi:hypothetical protein